MKGGHEKRMVVNRKLTPKKGRQRPERNQQEKMENAQQNGSDKFRARNGIKRPKVKAYVKWIGSGGERRKPGQKGNRPLLGNTIRESSTVSIGYIKEGKQNPAKNEQKSCKDGVRNAVTHHREGQK